MKWSITILSILAFVSASKAQPPEVLSAQKINRLLPSKISGYYLKGESRSSQMKLGTITYSLCERNFSKRDKEIKILLFDYVDAPIMYDQALNKWKAMKPIESDSSIFRPVDMTNVTGWEVYNKSSNQSQLILGINNRFFLTLSGDHMALFEVIQVFQQIDLSKFPN